MRKFLSAVLLTLSLASGTHGAVSEDMSVYVRKDVFEVYMQNINSNMEKIISKLDILENKINTLTVTVANLSGQVDELKNRVSDLRNGFYLVSVLFGILLGLPAFNKWYETRSEKQRENRMQILTREDVERLIEAKLSVRPQM